MKYTIIALLICTYAVNANAQIGTSDLAKTEIGQDSLSFQSIGKSVVEKCAVPGPCGSVCSVYTFTGAGNWSIEGNWEGGIMPPSTLAGCVQIVINPNGNNECLMNVPLQIIPVGASIIIMSGKKFRVPGTLVRQ